MWKYAFRRSILEKILASLSWMSVRLDVFVEWTQVSGYSTTTISLWHADHSVDADASLYRLPNPLLNHATHRGCHGFPLGDGDRPQFGYRGLWVILEGYL